MGIRSGAGRLLKGAHDEGGICSVYCLMRAMLGGRSARANNVNGSLCSVVQTVVGSVEQRLATSGRVKCAVRRLPVDCSATEREEGEAIEGGSRRRKKQGERVRERLAGGKGGRRVE